MSRTKKSSRLDPVALILALGPLTASALAVALQLNSRWVVVAIALIALTAATTGLWRVLQRLGTFYEIGAVLIYFGFIFWFFAPGMLKALGSRQFVDAAARIRIDNEDAVIAYLAISIFFFCFVAAYQLTNWQWLSSVQRRVFGAYEIKNPVRATRVLVISALVSLTFYTIVSGGVFSALEFIGGSRTVRKPWDSQGNYGTSLSPFHVFFSAILLAVAVHSIHLLLSQRAQLKTRLILGASAILATASIAVESGTRSSLLLCLAPPLLLYYHSERAQNRRIRISAAFVIVFFVLGALIASNIQREYRSTGQVGPTDLGVKDNDMLTQTAFAVAISQLEEDLTYDSPFMHIVTGPIPRVMWKGKPESEAVVIHSRYIWGVDIKERGGNTLPSIVGQYMLSWGWFGVIEIGLWIGLIVAAGDRAFSRLSRGAVGRLSYAVFVTYLLVSFRTIGFFFFMPVVATVLLGHVMARTRRRSSGARP